MVREIKFRAWDKKSKKMLYGDFCIWASSGRWAIYDDEDGGKSGLWEHNISDDYDLEVMQYTGLHDKNGKEIWEGDILSDSLVTTKDDPAKDGYFLYSEVIFSEGSFCGKEINGWDPMTEIYPLAGNYSRQEVIGNIYENPELLK
jgi:uncharacterized phage protein (TIGR01671 family)